MSDENIVFDGDTFANEGMRRNLTPTSNDGVLLNLDKGSDFGIVAYRATVQVDQFRLEDLYAEAQDNVVRNWHDCHSIRYSLLLKKCRVFIVQPVVFEQTLSEQLQR